MPLRPRAPFRVSRRHLRATFKLARERGEGIVRRRVGVGDGVAQSGADVGGGGGGGVRRPRGVIRHPDGFEGVRDRLGAAHRRVRVWVRACFRGDAGYRVGGSSGGGAAGGLRGGAGGRPSAVPAPGSGPRTRWRRRWRRAWRRRRRRRRARFDFPPSPLPVTTDARADAGGGRVLRSIPTRVPRVVSTKDASFRSGGSVEDASSDVHVDGSGRGDDETVVAVDDDASAPPRRGVFLRGGESRHPFGVVGRPPDDSPERAGVSSSAAKRALVAPLDAGLALALLPLAIVFLLTAMPESAIDAPEPVTSRARPALIDENLLREIEAVLHGGDQATPPLLRGTLRDHRPAERRRAHPRQARGRTCRFRRQRDRALARRDLGRPPRQGSGIRLEGAARYGIHRGGAAAAPRRDGGEEVVEKDWTAEERGGGGAPEEDARAAHLRAGRAHAAGRVQQTDEPRVRPARPRDVCAPGSALA